MLHSGAHTTQERRVRRAGVKKAALSSRISLLSGITTSSSGSSGSGSTITQESMSRPCVRGSKENGNQKEKRPKASSKNASTKGKNSPRKGKGIIDVFAFLDKDESRASLVQQRGKSGPSTDGDGTKYPAHDDSDVESSPKSLHSDSGISINDASSDHGSSNMSQSFNTKVDSPQRQQVPRHHRAAFVAEQRRYPKLQPIPQHVDEDHPEWYYGSADPQAEAGRPNPKTIEAAIQGDEGLPSGYDLLASRLSTSADPSDHSLPPLYRRFERLNHRILLQLQDEIAEMEEDLQHMDRADACERAARQGRTAPASRRLDWQWRGNELHARRLELLGRIYLKVEQYNQALAAFQRVAHTTNPAPADDIARYRAWMAEHEPVAQAEATYLDRAQDLLTLSVTQQPTPSTHLLPLPSLTLALITSTTATALPILLFRIVPAFSSRLTVILLLVPSLSFIPRPAGIGVEGLWNGQGREARQFWLVYLTVLVFAALVV